MMVQATSYTELQSEQLTRKLTARQNAAAVSTADLSAAAEVENAQATTDSASVSQAVQQSQTKISHKPDTVDISQQGREALAAMQQQSATESTTAEPPASSQMAEKAAQQAEASATNQMAEKAEQQAEASTESTMEATASDTSSSNANLSSYTEQQLNQMVSDGSITASEVQVELQRRLEATAQQQGETTAAQPQNAAQPTATQDDA